MKRINDIFYSLQGEGHNTGRAAVFIRFAGCNLRCPFCDTEFDTYREMDDEQILAAISPYPARFVVLTGGEPTLQVDEAFVELLHQHGYEVAMESNGTRPAPQNLDWLTVSPKNLGGGLKVEGGGLKVEGEGWKVEGGGRLPDEVKVVFDEDTDPETFLLPPSTLHLPPSTLHLPPSTFHLQPKLYLQPCDTGDAIRNDAIIARCIEYIKEHPWWRLSLQTHKLVGFK